MSFPAEMEEMEEMKSLKRLNDQDKLLWLMNNQNQENPFLRKILFRVLHALSCNSACMQAYCQPYT